MSILQLNPFFVNHERSRRHRRNARPYEERGYLVTQGEVRGEGGGTGGGEEGKEEGEAEEYNDFDFDDEDEDEDK